MVVTHEEPVTFYEGHPVKVEAAVSLGGKEAKQGITVFRFANRIPLLFQEGHDVTTQSCHRTRWSSYGIKEGEQKIGVYVSVVSTKVMRRYF